MNSIAHEKETVEPVAIRAWAEKRTIYNVEKICQKKAGLPIYRQPGFDTFQNPLKVRDLRLGLEPRLNSKYGFNWAGKIEHFSKLSFYQFHLEIDKKKKSGESCKSCLNNLALYVFSRYILLQHRLNIPHKIL